jgi:hypothetical protein
LTIVHSRPRFIRARQILLSASIECLAVGSGNRVHVIPRAVHESDPIPQPYRIIFGTRRLNAQVISNTRSRVSEESVKVVGMAFSHRAPILIAVDSRSVLHFIHQSSRKVVGSKRLPLGRVISIRILTLDALDGVEYVALALEGGNVVMAGPVDLLEMDLVRERVYV